MSPADAIAMLDRQIAQHGQGITLRRVVANAPAIEAPHRAFVRGYRPDELSGGLQQNDSLLILSPTKMPAAFSGASNRIRPNDKIEVSGRTRNVQFADHVEVGGVVVRINVTVRG